MAARSAERKEFLTYLLITAIEHAGYGFPGVKEYEPDADQPFAVIYDRYEEDNDKTWRVNLDTMAKGLGVLRTKVAQVEKPAQWVQDLLLSDRTNGSDGDYDVIGALAVLECAVFGDITYN